MCYFGICNIVPEWKGSWRFVPEHDSLLHFPLTCRGHLELSWLMLKLTTYLNNVFWTFSNAIFSD